MNNYIEHLLQLYKDKIISHEAALSLLEKYKALRIREDTDPIAVIGVACKMPMAENKEAFWNNLKNGVNCIRAFPKERRDTIDPLIPYFEENLHSVKNPYWQGGFLSSVDSFDHDFFGISPNEARIMDPQQRLFMEIAHAAFEDAGYSIKKLKGTNTGIYIGDVVNEYRKLVSEVSPLAVIGNISPFIASRVSYFYDLHGPTVNISTTCSTSLVAVHLACQALQMHECDLILAGASNLRLFPFALKDDPIDALGITTQKGACFAFDNRASGIVRGEGVGAIVLKRYKDAVRDNDPIYCLIRGSHVNNDGHSSNMGSPNPLAHEKLLKTAWKKSNIDPRQISYIEAHGTGTHIGDPIEIQGITKAFEASTRDRQFCAIGSVKTNIGHLTGGASGLAGLIKTILSMHYEELPPSLHFETPNEFIDFPTTPVYVQDRLTSWKKGSQTRLAGVSAFGFNGTNCHMVIEESPLAEETAHKITKKLPILFTHRTSIGLRKTIECYLAYLKQHTPRLEDLSYTLAIGRDHYPLKHLVLATSIEDLTSQLESYQNNNPPKEVIDWGNTFNDLKPKIISLPTYIFERNRHWIDTVHWQDQDKLPKSNKNIRHTDAEEPILEELLRLFEEALGVEVVKEEDDFFDLGGDSLLGIEVITLIHKRFNKKITYQELFENSKIRELAKLLGIKENHLFEDIPKAPQLSFYPLSYGQRRLWILHQMQDNPIAYNIYDVYEFNSPLDLTSFKQSLDQLLQRHAGLRTTFFEREGEPYQHISTQTTFDLVEEIASSKQDALKKIQLFKEQPFDLEKGPLTCGLLIRVSRTSSIFMFKIHHIIADGWSIRTIIEELLQFYRAKKLLPLKIDILDYCHWQKHKALNHNRFTELETYWHKRFEKPLPVCEIPGDLPRPAVFTFLGAKEQFTITTELEERLSVLAKEEKATLFMLLLASVFTLIHKFTGQKDLIIGTPVSGRSHASLKPLVGFFVNTLAIRCSIDPKQTFSKFLNHLRDITLQDFENQDYPFDYLIDQLNLERDTSRSPLFNVNVAFQNFEIHAEAQAALDQLKASKIPMPHQSCKWDLEFEFVKEPGRELVCNLEYYKEIYSKEMISSLIQTFKSLLESIAKTPRLDVSDLAYSPNSSNIEGPKVAYQHIPLHRLFEDQVIRSADITAIKTVDQNFTYAELNKKSNQLAHFLIQRIQIQKEQLIGIFLENSFEAITSILGILKAGGAYVPLDFKSPKERISKIIKESGIKHLISSSKHLKILNELLWSSPLNSYTCLDTSNLDQVYEEDCSNLMDTSLWNQVAQEADNEIASSGWVSSYTGELFSIEEMNEYTMNVWEKLKNHIHPTTRILEIGCGSGLTAFALAPHAGYYLGVDLSDAIISKNRTRAQNEMFKNLDFACYPAHQIDQLKEDSFDIVIINSVIHCFPGHNYLKMVLRKACDLMKKKSLLFLGDLMDLDLKDKLKESTQTFKQANLEKGYRTKVDWEQELFISREFVNHLSSTLPVAEIACGKKIGQLKNELSLYRFDALLSIDKSIVLASARNKNYFDQSNLVEYSNKNPNLNISDRNLAYVLYTSGSTGSPKGVMVEHRSVHNYINWATSFYEKTRLCFPLHSPLHFDLTVTSIFTPLMKGDFLQILTGEVDEILQNFKTTEGCNIAKVTPAHLTMLADQELVPKKITQYIVGGETLYASQAKKISSFYSQPINIYNEYGPTEATVGCIVHEWRPNESQDSVLIGKPIANCNVHIVDESYHPVPIGGIGEILIEGDVLARGYLNDEILTQKKFRLDPVTKQRLYHTGDLARYLPNGEIAYVGRRDRQVKVKGYRIELDEVESCLLKHPQIDSAVALTSEQTPSNLILIGYFVSSKSLQSEEVSSFLSKQLPAYMIPSFIIQVDALPLTHNGKVDIEKLPKPSKAKSSQSIQPQSQIEVALHKIWSKVLNVPETELSISDDFFDLGGDSIMAMRILPQVRRLGLQLTLKEIFLYRTIKTLAQKTSCKPSPVVAQDEVTGKIPFSPVQSWFWDQLQSIPSYFTMAYLFAVPEQLCISLLKQAFEACFKHHDALRVCFLQNEQTTVPFDDLSFQIEQYSLCHLSYEDQQKQIVKITDKIQKSFDLSKAPLLKAALFDLGSGEKRLYLTIHHLIIDGVSWRFLIEDLSMLYQSKLQSKLPQKTESFKTWSDYIHSLSTLDSTLINPWLEIDPHSFPKLVTAKLPVINETCEEFIRFSKDETLQLITKSKSFYDANPNELLLSALALSLDEAMGYSKVLINHEGHGRDTFENLDISRTMGWFTTIYPLILEKKENAISTLQGIQKSLKYFGDKDLFFMIGKYIQKHPHLKNFEPEILFNYFGRVDEQLLSENDDQLFWNCEESIANTSDSKNHLPHQLEINCIIINDQLRISIMCNPGNIGHQVLQNWISSFKKQIQKYILLKSSHEHVTSSK